MGSTTAPELGLPTKAYSPPKAVDFLVAIIAGIVTMMLIHLDPEASPRTPDGFAFGMGAIAAAALVFRRPHPQATLGVVLGVHIFYHLVGYPGAGPFPSLMVALFGMAAAGLRWGAIVAAFGVAATALLMQVLAEDTPILSPTIIMPAVLAAASVFAGEAAHNRSRYLAEVRERLRRVEQNREIETQRRLTEERLRIARELHDIMAHTITVITVQAGEAQDALETSPEQTREALRNIRDASKEAMAELRATVGVLRETGEPGESRKPAPGMRDLAELVQTAGGGGLATTLEVRGDARPLPAAAELTAFRVVQESLTNVIRHAGATRASVVVSYEPSSVTVEVEDDGRGSAGSANGHGIRGMRERAEAVGGRLEAGPKADGGFRVRAVLPAELQP
jgi:signal transduction histidine kinase